MRCARPGDHLDTATVTVSRSGAGSHDEPPAGRQARARSKFQLATMT
tara:strand:+ start:12108 stop:12248 length:141 start_codon:yes stop_codon:yes gene_type:complete